MFWTGLPMLLAAVPYSYGTGQISLFRLCALPGALLAGTVGRLNICLYGLKVTNQSVVSSLSETRRSRFTAIYIFFGLIGAACGAATASALFGAIGWSAMCSAGAMLSPALMGYRFVAQRTDGGTRARP